MAREVSLGPEGPGGGQVRLLPALQHQARAESQEAGGPRTNREAHEELGGEVHRAQKSRGEKVSRS